MPDQHRILIAAAGTVLAILGGLWGAWGPIAALAEAGEVIWVTRLALVAGIGAMVGAASVVRGRVQAGAALSLACGVVVIGAGSAGAGIVVVLGATMALGAGEQPDPAELVEALADVAP